MAGEGGGLKGQKFFLWRLFMSRTIIHVLLPYVVKTSPSLLMFVNLKQKEFCIKNVCEVLHNKK
jgi:hypothetical protein